MQGKKEKENATEKYNELMSRGKISKFNKEVRERIGLKNLKITHFKYPLDEKSLFYVIGTLMGDGTIHQNGLINKVALMATDYEFVEKFKREFESIVEIDEKIRRISQSKNAFGGKDLYKYSCSRKKVVEFFIDKINGLDLTNDMQGIEFLRGMFDSEGCVTYDRDRSILGLSLSNKDRKVLSLLRKILTDFKIVFYEANDNKGVTSIRTYNRNALKLYFLFGNILTIKRKDDRIKEYLTTIESKNIIDREIINADHPYSKEFKEKIGIEDSEISHRLNVQRIGFMLCNKTDNLIENGRWIFQQKYDGILCCVRLTGRQVRLYNREMRDITRKFPEIVESIIRSIVPNDAIFIGEIISRDGDFNKIQSRVHSESGFEELRNMLPSKIVLFDEIYSNSRNLRGFSYEKRYKILNSCVLENEVVKIAENFVDLSKIEEFKREGGEGIIFKNLEGIYENVRSNNSLKYKFWKEKVVEFQNYELMPHGKGITLTNKEGIKVAVSGEQSKDIKKRIDRDGKIRGNVQFLQETKRGKLRFLSWRGLI